MIGPKLDNNYNILELYNLNLDHSIVTRSCCVHVPVHPNAKLCSVNARDT